MIDKINMLQYGTEIIDITNKLPLHRIGLHKRGTYCMKDVNLLQLGYLIN